MIKLYRLHLQKKKRIEQVVNEMPISAEFKPLITDIVLRRALQFTLSDELLEEDLASLKANLKEVVISDKILEERETVLAAYFPEEKKIAIAPQTLAESPEILFQILSHEVYHALSKDRNGIDRFDRYNTILEKYSEVYEELVVEKASYRATFPTRHDLTGLNKNAYGYDDLVFVLDMIEATYGVNEQDLLEHAIFGRDCLAEFLAKRDGSKNGIEAVYQFLEEMEVGASLLWSTVYPQKKKERKKEDVEANIECSLDALFKICEDKILQRMSNSRTRSLKEAKLLKEEIAFCQYRLKNIIKAAIEEFEKDGEYSIRAPFLEHTKKYRRECAKRLNYMQQISESTDFESPQEQLRIFRRAKRGKFSDKYFEDNEMDGEVCKWSVSEKYIREGEELEGYCYGWDNTFVVNQCKKIVRAWEAVHGRPDLTIDPDSKTEYTTKKNAEIQEDEYSRD
ncbi:MAG: hypothetical protein IKE01_05485 [Clostridia bacterium]|nr:hypothetical protein [Clostridia bacterium]